MRNLFPFLLGMRFLAGRRTGVRRRSPRSGSDPSGETRAGTLWGLSPYLRGSVIGIGLSLIPWWSSWRFPTG
jgi:hypothetical protein